MSSIKMLTGALALLLIGAVPASAVECSEVAHEGLKFALCRVDAAQEDLRLFLNDGATGMPLGSFNNVDTQLQAEGLRLAFGMNAGMYHADRSPVGHYMQDGKTLQGVIASAGPGNFGLLPNGVFCIREDRADVFETKRFLHENPTCRDATQSGPMLVIGGQLHPRFLPDSDSRYIRNGVGSSADGREVWFAISQSPVTFHEFGRFFRDNLKVPQALYFDGNISRLYAPEIGRHDGGFPMGPMVGVTEASH